MLIYKGARSSKRRGALLTASCGGSLCSVCLPAASGTGACWGPLCSTVCFCSPQGKSNYGSPEKCGKCWAASGNRECKGELLPASAGLVQLVPTGPKCVIHDIFNHNTSVSVSSCKLNQQWCLYIIFFAFSCIRKLGFSWVRKMFHVLCCFFDYFQTHKKIYLVFPAFESSWFRVECCQMIFQ